MKDTISGENQNLVAIDCTILYLDNGWGCLLSLMELISYIRQLLCRERLNTLYIMLKILVFFIITLSALLYMRYKCDVIFASACSGNNNTTLCDKMKNKSTTMSEQFLNQISKS
jgi:hypothetical protein